MSTIIYDILGGGGLSKTFTDWTSARQFVKQTINQNPRISDATKKNLLDAEQKAYEEATKDKNVLDYIGDLIDLTPSWFQAQSPIDYYADNREVAQIATYFNLLKKDFPAVTDDQRFLNIYDAASDVQADKIDEEIISDTKFKLPTWAWLAIGFGVYSVYKK